MQDLSIELHVTTSEKSLTADSWVFVASHEGDDAMTPHHFVESFPSWSQAECKLMQSKRKFETKVANCLAFDSTDGVRKSFAIFDPTQGLFEWLTQSRKIVADAVVGIKAKTVVIDLRGCDVAEKIADAFVAATATALYKFPKYKTKISSTEKIKSKVAANHNGTEDDQTLTLTFIVDRAKLKSAEKSIQVSLHTAVSGTNLVRWLAKRAGNDLTCESYVAYIQQLAKTRKWKFEHIDHDKLTKLSAGAFLAVVRGSEHRDYGIIKLTYAPSSAKKSLALVGKGIMFDTGGHSLKPSQYMLGMHGDMAGSAVALALINVATTQQWPVAITSYLAVADNMIGPKAYKPNDVITAMNGTTIEIIDTDAEGRMVLADTLHLASREQPDLLLDFATLTGSCVKAIGTTFSGVFTNRSALHATLIESGYQSGERVWPFPMDKDFADCLDSTTADVKQCREKGGVDHIEASQFLSKFVDKKTPWVHVDLSAIENTGGLAHVPTDETGFGVRFASEFIRRQLKF